MNNIEVLYTSYYDKFGFYARYQVMLIASIICLLIVLTFVANDVCNWIMIGFIIISIVCFGYSLFQTTIKTDYVDYEYVLLNEKTVDKDFFSNWKIREIKGEIYVIEPVKKGSVKKENVSK